MRLIWRVGIGVGAIVLGAIALVFLIPTERVSALAIKQFEAFSGHKLTIEGEITPRLWPALGVEVKDISIFKADLAGEQPALFQAKSLLIEINHMALLGGEIEVQGLKLDAPQFFVERGGDGTLNWDVFSGSTHDALDLFTGSADFSLHGTRLSGANLRYRDARLPQDLVFEDIDLELDMPNYLGAFAVDARGGFDAQDFHMRLGGDRFSSLLTGDLVEADLQFSLGKSHAAFRGSLGHGPMVAKGVVEVNLRDPVELLKLFVPALTPLPEGLGREHLRFGAEMTYNQAGALYLRQAKFELDHNVIWGEVDVTPKLDRPLLSGNLRAEALRFGAENASYLGADSGLWARDEIDVSWLMLADVSLSLASQRVDLYGIELGPNRMLVKLDRARAVFDLRQLSAYGGAVNGTFVVNGRGGLSVGGDLNFTMMQLDRLLPAILGVNWLSGAADFNLDFLGVGNSVSEIMHSFQGKSRIVLGPAKAKGIDLAKVLRHFDLNYIGADHQSVLDGAFATFDIEEGQARVADLHIWSPYVQLSGQGDVSLARQYLDLTLKPAVFLGPNAPSVLVPLVVAGPWYKPQYRLDLAAVAREKMQAEAQRSNAYMYHKNLQDTDLPSGLSREMQRVLQEQAGQVFR